MVGQRDGWLRTIVLLAGGLAYWPAWGVADADTAAEKTTAPRQVEPVEIKAEPLKLTAGGPLSTRALVARPIPIRGVMSWSLETRRHRGAIFTVTISPDGRTVATGGIDGTIRLWDVETGKFLKALIGHDSYIYHLAWSPDGQTLASAGSWDATARLWDVKSGLLLRKINHEKGYVSLVAWSPTGTRMAFAGGESGTVHSVAWMADGKTLASGSADKTIRVWKAPEHKSSSTKSSASKSTTNKTDEKPADDAASPATDAAATKSASSNKAADVLLQTFKGHEGPVTHLAFAPTAKMLASGSTDKSARLWNITTGKQVSSMNVGWPVYALTWAPDGKTLGTSGADERLNFWNPVKGELLQHLDYPGSPPSVSSIAWFPNGSVIASGRRNHTLQLWDARGGKLVVPSLAAMAPVVSVTWTPGGSTIAAACEDRTVRFWDASNGQLRGHLIAEDNEIVAIAAEGHFRADPGIEADLVYVVQTEKTQETLSISEFVAKSKLKNVPAQAKIMGN